MITDCDGKQEHFMRVKCVECTAEAFSLRPLEDIEGWFEFSIIGTEARDAYRHVWALSATRSKAYDHWKAYPEGEFARAVASALVRRLPGASYHR